MKFYNDVSNEFLHALPIYMRRVYAVWGAHAGGLHARALVRCSHRLLFRSPLLYFAAHRKWRDDSGLRTGSRRSGGVALRPTRGLAQGSQSRWGRRGVSEHRRARRLPLARRPPSGSRRERAISICTVSSSKRRSVPAMRRRNMPPPTVPATRRPRLYRHGSAQTASGETRPREMVNCSPRPLPVKAMVSRYRLPLAAFPAAELRASP